MLNNVFDGYNVTIFAYGQTVCIEVGYESISFLLFFDNRVQEKHLL